MKTQLMLTAIFIPFISYAQVPLSEFQGRLDVHLPNRTSSLHIGHLAGHQDTSSRSNTFVGSFAGQDHIIGNYNSFFGAYAGGHNTEGKQNSFFGAYSGGENETGSYNSFFGDDAGYYNYTGSYNTFIGSNAGEEHYEGSYATFVGYNAGNSSSGGQSNVAIGTYSLAKSESKSYNVAIGDSSMYQVGANLPPQLGPEWGQKNTALGHASLKSTGGGGSFNSVALGYHAGYEGAVNSVIAGYQAGTGLVTNSVLIGNMAGHGLSNITNKLMITNDEDDSPLLYGEFDTDILQTNGIQRISRADAQQLEIINSGAGGNTWRISSSNNSWNAGGGKLLIGTSSNTANARMTINENGNIGIGTTTPDSKLEVNGKVNIGNDNVSAQAGDIRFNSATNDFEGYNGTSWLSLTGNANKVYTLNLSGAEVTPRKAELNRYTMESDNGYIFMNDDIGQVYNFMIPLTLPEGTTIREVSYNYRDVDPQYDMHFALRRYNRNANGRSDFYEFSSSNISPAGFEVETIVANHTLASNHYYAFWISVRKDFNDPDWLHELMGIQLKYMLP